MNTSRSIISSWLDRPIAYHRVFVDLTGSVNGAVMLSQAVYWSQRTKDPDGWFYKSASDWQEETGLSRREQETVRKAIKEAGFWSEERRGVPATLNFKVEFSAIFSRLHELSNLNGQMSPNVESGCDKSANLLYTETTTETTTSDSNESVPEQSLFPDLKEDQPAQKNKKEKVEKEKALPEYGRFLEIWMETYKMVGIRMPRDGAKIKSLILATRQVLTARGIAPSETLTIEFWDIFVKNLHKTWGHGKDLPTIDSKYTTLIFELENGKTTNTAKKQSLRSFVNSF